MDNFLLAHIAQRMNEMGYKGFHFEPAYIFVDAPFFEIKAYNEFYYLTSKFVDAQLLIISDTNIFNEAANFSFYNFYGIQEFSGLIEISQFITPMNLEFVRVIPTCN